VLCCFRSCTFKAAADTTHPPVRRACSGTIVRFGISLPSFLVPLISRGGRRFGVGVFEARFATPSACFAHVQGASTHRPASGSGMRVHQSRRLLFPVSLASTTVRASDSRCCLCACPIDLGVVFGVQPSAVVCVCIPNLALVFLPCNLCPAG
jgi:hypothetical protein